MTLALCPGSFDPVTNGHLDIIERAASHFEHVIVAIIGNPSKEPLFTLEERKTFLLDSLFEYDNVEIDSFNGLLVKYAKARGVNVIVKGLRAVSDFDYEIQMAQMNHRLTGVDTFFLPTRNEYSYLSASLVREIASFGGEIEGVVPGHVELALKKRFPL